MNKQICLHCQYWEGKREIDPDHPLQHFATEWRDGRCCQLQSILDIDLHTGWDGGTVRWIKTTASFGCVAFEEVNQN